MMKTLANSALRWLITVMLLGSFAPWSMAQSLSPSTYKKLTEIQELMAESQFDEAITLLTELETKVAEDSLSKAIVLQTWGYAEMSNNQYDKAAVKFRASLAVGKLPEAAAHNVRFMIAQLYAGEGRFAEALKEAEIWHAALATPKPHEHMFMANVHAQLKNFPDAVKYAEAAIAIAEEPRESWFQLLLACHFEQKQYPKAAGTLQRLIAGWPTDATYWEQLASVNMLMDNETKALAVLRLAWQQQLLDKESSIRSMAQLAFSEGIPEHAGRLLQAALEQEILPSEEKYLKMLAAAWVQAKEDKQAVAAYSALAEVSEDGEPLMKQAQILLGLEDWSGAEQALNAAIDKGLEKPGRAWLFMGISQVERGQFKQGKQTLRKAQAFDDVSKQASAWLAYADQKRSHWQWKKRQS